MMVLLTKLVNDVNLKTSTILAKDEFKMSPECFCLCRLIYYSKDMKRSKKSKDRIILMNYFHLKFKQ